MTTGRTTATIVGVLYIIGTVAGVLSVVATGPFRDASDYLIKVSASQDQVIMGALLVLIMGLALAMVPVVMFPVARRHNEVLAIGYVVFRGGLETVTCMLIVISWLLLVPLSQAYVQAGAPDASNFQVLGTLLLGVQGIGSTIGEIVFPLGALMFYYLLYRSRLIPRWMSGWGLITAIPYLAAGLLLMFHLTSSSSTIHSVLVFPLALQEMVMAVWLIVKGFNPSAVASEADGFESARHSPTSLPRSTKPEPDAPLKEPVL